MTRLSILVADDSPEVCSLLTIWLGDHQVVSVYSGTEALAATALLHFDLVVTDVHMPDVSGLEVIRRLKQNQPTVRILAISGGSRYVSSSDCVTAAKKAGADAAILKPFNEELLLNAVREALAPTTVQALPNAFTGVVVAH